MFSKQANSGYHTFMPFDYIKGKGGEKNKINRTIFFVFMYRYNLFFLNNNECVLMNLAGFSSLFLLFRSLCWDYLFQSYKSLV